MKTLKVALVAACAVVVGWAFTASADIPASAYVQDGLIAQWDGIDNAGTGTHDPNATTWVDLKGENNLTLTKVTFGENCAKFASGKAIGAQTYTLENGLTFEIYAKSTAATGDMLSFQSSSTTSGFNFFCYSSQYRPYDGSKASFAKDETAGMSVVVSEDGLSHSFYKNGSYVEAKSYTSREYQNLFVSLGVLRNMTSGRTLWNGSMYSVRVYNRALTADEVAKNALVDRLRFSAVPPEGYRWNAETEKIEVRVSVALKGAGGTVSVAGGGSEAWVEPNATVPITVTTPEGTSVVLWRGGTPTETGAGAYSVKADVPVALTVSVGKRLCTWTGAAGDGLWATDGNWDTGSAPAAGECVLVGEGASVTCTVQTAQLASFELAGGTLVFKEPVRCTVADAVTELRAKTVEIMNAAKVTHLRMTESVKEWSDGGKGDWQIDGRVFFTCTDFFLSSDSSINVEGMGYNGRTSNGSPCGPSVQNGGSLGAGHGGNAAGVGPYAADWAHPTCGTYDDPVHPVLPGSSGASGNSKSDYGLDGGGVVRIAATGSVVIDGAVNASAREGGGSQRSGGSGGSIWISAGTVSGTGALLALGRSNNSEGNENKCGGGGCIALHYDPEEQAKIDVPALKINVGVSGRSTVRTLGDVGTLYLPDTRFLGESYSDQRGIVAANLLVGDWGTWAPTRLTLSNAWLRFPSSVCKGWTLDAIGISGLYGRLDLGGEKLEMMQRGVTPIVSEETIGVSVTGDVTLGEKGRLHVFAAATNGLDETWASLAIGGNLSLASGSVLELVSHPTNGASCKVSCAALSVASGASITASGRGFGGCIHGKGGSGKGPGGGNGGGGSYGGFAYAQFPCGDAHRPTLAGSGGCTGDNASSGGSPGGGVVYLAVSGACEINGTVSADGSGAPGSSAGTGSGGSVYITAQTFSGAGTITANGGKGQKEAEFRSGSGGRIALICDAAAQAEVAVPPVYTFNAQAEGAVSGVRVKAADYGTLYLSDARMAQNSFDANKIQHCQLVLDDWSKFKLGAVSQTNTFVRLVEAPSMSAESIYLDNARLDFSGSQVARGYDAAKVNYRTTRGADIVVAGDVTLTNTSELIVCGGITNGNAGAINLDLAKTNSTLGARANELAVLSGTFTVGGKLTVCANAFVKPTSHPFDGGSVRIEARDLDVRLGGGFEASGLGWAAAQVGEKAGHGPGCGTAERYGAGYGGLAQGKKGRVYGYAKRPALPGSGAGRKYDGGAGGSGGGLIWLDVRHETVLDGSLVANGQNGGGTFGSGGSGGGIYLRTKQLVCGPEAKLTANGGNANSDGQRGGGGRIAVYTESGTVPDGLTATANAGASGGYEAAAESGTVYFGKLPGGTMVFVR